MDYNYNGATFVLSGNAGIASTSGADGILFAPNGNLLVAGQGFSLHELTTAGAAVATVNPGGPSFHLALSSSASNALVYNMWNGRAGAAISAVQLSGGGLSGNGNAYTVIGAGISHDVRGVIYDPVHNRWYYGTAPDGGTGEFGTVVFDDTLHTATLTRLATGLYSHGLTYDPFTGDVFISSDTTIQQWDTATDSVVSTFVGLASDQFDQTSVDGLGHLFAASNINGNLRFIDYDATGLIGAGGNFTNSQFLADSLDDIAPLSGLGGGTVPEPSSVVLLGTVAALAALKMRRRKVA